MIRTSRFLRFALLWFRDVFTIMNGLCAAIALIASLMMLVLVVTVLVRCVLFVLSNGLFQRRAFAFGGHRGDDDGSEQGEELAVTAKVIESREKENGNGTQKTKNGARRARNNVFMTSATKLRPYFFQHHTFFACHQRIQSLCVLSLSLLSTPPVYLPHSFSLERE